MIVHEDKLREAFYTDTKNNKWVRFLNRVRYYLVTYYEILISLMLDFNIIEKHWVSTVLCLGYVAFRYY